ncbi:MAG: UDP-2,3-diacylglucosamine diphosphatase [Rubrivivax sp.]|nr:UDP-2,3-diacylglucosamine diphosphatase [Rubrivivax sp.]
MDAAGAAAAPAWQVFDAPAHWQRIDLLSDLHLCAALPLTFDAWATHLLHSPADAVFMLGDVFEAWVGDDARDQPFERRCVEVMAAAAQQRTLAFMVGNRDFLLGAEMRRACGLVELADPTLLTLAGRRVLLTHGDALCLADTEYQDFRRQVRSSDWQQAFLAQPLAQRLQIAAEMRRRSESRRRYDGDSAADVDAPTALRWLQAAGAADMVHGHTHRPGRHALAPGFTRHVLSDWDLDHASPVRADLLRLSVAGIERLAPAGTAP